MTTLRKLRLAMDRRREDFNRVLDECPLDSVEPGRRIERFLLAKLKYEKAVQREKLDRRVKKLARRTRKPLFDWTGYNRG